MKGEISTNIANITQGDVATLRKNKIVTYSDLWSAVGMDFDTGINNVAENAGLAPERLIEILVAAHEHESKSNERDLLRFWPEGALVATMVALIALALRAVGVWG